MSALCKCGAPLTGGICSATLAKFKALHGYDFLISAAAGGRTCAGCGKTGHFYGLLTFNGKRGYWHAACLKRAQRKLASGKPNR